MYGFDESQLMSKKREALEEVRLAVIAAGERLDANDGAGWRLNSEQISVCQRTGPHWEALCWLHRKSLELVAIPGARPSWNSQLYIGKEIDRTLRVYRRDYKVTYRAELIKRATSHDIRALIPKINRICPD